MPKLYYLLPQTDSPTAELSNEKHRRIESALVKYVYLQTNVAMIASLFCAGIVFIGLFEPKQNNLPLFIWAALFLIITVSRLLLSTFYQLNKNSLNSTAVWRNLYILGSLLGGASWGLAGIFLLPQVSPIQQTLMILMLAGITAGAVPLSAAIPKAAIGFLMFSIVPFIASIALFEDGAYLLFDVAVSLYLIYSITLTLKAYELIRNSIILQFENNVLIHNLEISNKKLEKAATHDSLTQAANRRFFISHLEESIKYAKKNKKILALFYIDLDNFKTVNDKHGHHAGDHILITVISRLKKYFRKEDIIARLGGDELAITIENLQDRQEIESIARKICDLIAEPIQMGDITLQVSASIGISIYPYDGVDEDSLLQCSDQFMYVAKKNGGNNFHLRTEAEFQK